MAGPIHLLSPTMVKPLGGGGGIEMLGVRVCVCPSVTKLVSVITSDFLHRFDPVMHPTMALDEFEDE